MSDCNRLNSCVTGMVDQRYTEIKKDKRKSKEQNKRKKGGRRTGQPKSEAARDRRLLIRFLRIINYCAIDFVLYSKPAFSTYVFATDGVLHLHFCPRWRLGFNHHTQTHAHNNAPDSPVLSTHTGCNTTKSGISHWAQPCWVVFCFFLALGI